MKIIVSPVDYNHDETAIIFYCRAKDREDYMRVYGILISSCATTKFNLMVGPTGEEQKTYIENIKQYK